MGNPIARVVWRVLIQMATRRRGDESSEKIEGWEPLRWSKRDIGAWLNEQLLPIARTMYTKKEAERVVHDGNAFKEPKRMSITIVYEVED